MAAETTDIRIARTMLTQGRKSEALAFLKDRGYLLHGSRKNLEVIKSRSSYTSLPGYAGLMATRPTKGTTTGNEKRVLVSSRKFNNGFIYVVPRDGSQRPYDIRNIRGRKQVTEYRTESQITPLMRIPVTRSDLLGLGVKVRWSPALAVKHRLQEKGILRVPGEFVPERRFQIGPKLRRTRAHAR